MFRGAYDHQTDICSAEVALFEMVCGTLPSKTATDESTHGTYSNNRELEYLITKTEPEFPLDMDISEEVKNLILRVILFPLPPPLLPAAPVKFGRQLERAWSPVSPFPIILLAIYCIEPPKLWTLSCPLRPHKSV